MEKARIFIVEDEALVARDIEISLGDLGFAVSGTASSGEKAIIKVGENRPDLVLMDIMLKGEMNGIETASEIRARFNIPVIYLTAHADEEMFQSAKLTEPFGYILKPFEERDLGRTIDMALYRHKMGMKAKRELEVNKSLSELYKPLISPAASMGEIADTVLDNARRLTGSAHGFVGTIDPDTGDLIAHTLSEMMKDHCEVRGKEKKTVFPCGKDGRYPGLWGHALNKKEAFFTNKPEDHPALKGVPDGHLPLHRFLTVPVMLEKEPVGQIALANKDADYTEDDLKAIIRVAEFYALAIQKIRAAEALQKAHDELEKRVRERTADLVESNADLKNEIETRRKAEISLMDNQEILKAFLDAIPNPAFLVETSEIVIMANKAFPESFEIEGGEQIIGANLSDFLSHEVMERRKAYVDKVITTKKPLYYESIDNGKTLNHHIYPVFDSRGEVTRLANLDFDVSYRKQMERQLIQSEKLASIGFLVSGVAHEINNPNNFITFNIPILRDYLKELAPIIDGYAENNPDFKPFGMAYPEFKEDLFKILDNIELGSRRINSTVSDLRDFSRKKEKTVSIPIAIKEVIEKAVSISRGKIGRMVKTLEVSIPEDMPRVHTDPETVEHILINLLINAAQASDKEDSWVVINARMGDSWGKSFIIEVKDNGSGMDKETTAKIFDPFFTTKPQGVGTGLGLTLCQNLAATLEGRMEIESEPGKGSTFRLLLPGEERRAEPGKSSTSEQQPKRRRKDLAHILIIDDDDDVRMNLREMLENEGYRVADASDGKKGMRLFRKSPADLVITDIFMPEQEGLETVKELRKDFPTVKIIVISGRGRLDPEPYLEIAERFGADKTLAKPFRREDLLRAVDELLSAD